MINEDAPTMSAGTGGFSGSAAATGPVAGFDPMLGKGKKVKKRKYKPKGHVVTNVGIGESMSYFPYRVQYDDSQDYILYGKSEAEIKIELRKAYRPEMFKRLLSPDCTPTKWSSFIIIRGWQHSEENNV